MRIIARKNLRAFCDRHPPSTSSIERWLSGFETSVFQSMVQVQAAYPKAKVLNAERVRFELTGGCRLIVALKFKNQIAFIKFVGTHAEYDRVDALTVSQF